MLNRDAVLKASDQTYATVEVPEWGGSIRIRQLTGKQQEITNKINNAKCAEPISFGGYAAAIVCFGCVDEHGNRLFQDIDAKALGERDAGAINRVAVEILKLSGATIEAQQDIEKN